MNINIRNMYRKLSQEKNELNLSGFEIARKISNKISKEEPHIIKKNGRYLDYYDSNRNVIKLSTEVFDGTDMYAAIVAINTALETDTSKIKVAKRHRFSSFLILTSYSMIILGSLLNNGGIIHFGFILFILAFIIEILLLNCFSKTEIKKLFELIKKEKVIKLNEKRKENIIFMLSLNIARLPYGFINYFK